MSGGKPDFDALVAIFERIVEPLSVPFGERALSLAGVTSGQAIIDVAAGTGGMSVAAARAGARVLATDIADAMVARTAERLRPYPGCEARTMPAEALDVPDAGFDASFSLFGVTLFTAWREGLAELFRVTRPQGHVVLATWIEPEGAEPMVILRRAFDRTFPGRGYWPGGHLNEWSERSLQDALREIGCVDVSVHRHHADFTGRSAAGMLEDLEPIFRQAPGYGALTDEERARLAGPLREAFEAHAVPDGSIRVPSPGLIAVGLRPA